MDLNEKIEARKRERATEDSKRQATEKLTRQAAAIATVSAASPLNDPQAGGKSQPVDAAAAREKKEAAKIVAQMAFDQVIPAVACFDSGDSQAC